MVADVVTLVFQLSLVGAASAVLIGLVRDELADFASMPAIGTGPARWTDEVAEHAPVIDAVGARTGTARSVAPRVVRRRPARPASARARRGGLAPTPR